MIILRLLISVYRKRVIFFWFLEKVVKSDLCVILLVIYIFFKNGRVIISEVRLEVIKMRYFIGVYVFIFLNFFICLYCFLVLLLMDKYLFDFKRRIGY